MSVISTGINTVRRWFGRSKAQESASHAVYPWDEIGPKEVGLSADDVALPNKVIKAECAFLMQRVMRNLGNVPTHRDVRWWRAKAQMLFEVLEALGLEIEISEEEVRQVSAEAEERTKASDEYARQRETNEMWMKAQRANQDREFWVEQSRSLQNQIQQQNALMGRVMDHLAGLDAGGGEDVRALLQDISARLREPVVGVEAARAAMALARDDAQGEYTAARPRALESDAREVRAADSPRGGKAKAKPEKAAKTARKKAAKKAPAKRGKTKTARKRTTRTKAST